MFDLLRRWAARSAPRTAWRDVESWSEQQDLTFRTTHDRDGFVIDNTRDAWRLEWGPSHRHYIGPHELRLRGDTGIDPATVAVLMPRTLLESLERDLYGQFVEGVQTRVDDQTPDEVRWLAMAPRLGASELGPLKGTLAGVCNIAPWAGEWLSGPTGESLLAWTLPVPDRPAPVFVLMAHQGRLVLRVRMAAPQPSALAAVCSVFEVALAGARRFGGDRLAQPAGGAPSALQ